MIADDSPWSGLRALGLLMRLQWRARIRGWLRGLKRPKTLVGTLLLVGLMGLVVWGRSLGDGRGEVAAPSGGVVVPVLVTLFLALSTVGSLANGALAFSPAEAQFLLPGPLGTRALVFMQTLDGLIKSALGSIFIAAFLSPKGIGFLRAVAGYTLLFGVLTFLGTAIDLAHARVPRVVRRRRARWLGFTLLGVAIATVTWTVVQEGPWPSSNGFTQQTADTVRELMGKASRPINDESTTWLHADALRHLGWPARPMLGLLRPDRGAAGLLDHGILLLLTGGLFAFQLRRSSGFREAAGETSARVAAVVEKARAGKMYADSRKRTSGRVLPMLPRWGGAGPHIWRQLSILLRLRKTYLTLVVTAVFIGAVNVFVTEGNTTVAAATVLGWLAVMGPFYVQCDFRSDYECLAWLRSLPCSPTALAAGQVLASSLVLTVFELALAGWVLLLPELPRRELWLLAFAALPFVNVIQFAVENAIWLLYPTRASQGQGTPGAGQFGRMYALMLVKFVVLGVLAVPWVLGAVLWGPAGALAAGVPVALFACVLSVKALGLAFSKADPPQGAGG